MRKEGKLFEAEQLSLAEKFCNSKADPDSIVKEYINKDISNEISLLLFISYNISYNKLQLFLANLIQRIGPVCNLKVSFFNTYSIASWK